MLPLGWRFMGQLYCLTLCFPPSETVQARLHRVSVAFDTNINHTKWPTAVWVMKENSAFRRNNSIKPLIQFSSIRLVYVYVFITTNVISGALHKNLKFTHKNAEPFQSHTQIQTLSYILVLSRFTKQCTQARFIIQSTKKICSVNKIWLTAPSNWF